MSNICVVLIMSYSRCCCGRPENQHSKLTTVQEENEELEIAHDVVEDSDCSNDSQSEGEC